MTICLRSQSGDGQIFSAGFSFSRPRPYLREQLAEVEKGIENLVNAIQMGIFNEATKKRMDDLETRKTELNIQIAKEELAKPTVTKAQIICWLEHFRTFDTNKFEHRRRFIDIFINRIFLYDDKIIITFNYNKGTKTITFADLEVSGILSHSNISPTGEPKKSARLIRACRFFCMHCLPKLRRPVMEPIKNLNRETSGLLERQNHEKLYQSDDFHTVDCGILCPPCRLSSDKRHQFKL